MRTGMRNQNIYTAAVVPAAAFGALGNNKPMTPLGENPKTHEPVRRAFAVFARNTTGQNLVFRFAVAKEPKFGDASFLEFGSLDVLDVAVGAFSSVSRPVFVWSTLAKDTATIDISQVDAVGGSPVVGGLHGSVVLNPDATAPDVEGDLATTETHTPNLENPDLVNWGPGTFNPLNPDLINPNLENPDLVNYDIVNPNLENPDLVNPNLVTPDLINPNLENKNLINPNLENPNLENTSLADAQVTDVRWKVTNAGNTVTSYSFKTFSKEAVPAGIYLQLLIYRVHYTPGISKTDCDLKKERHDELLANIINPNLINPNLVNPNLENPNLENPNLENATFSLAPGDEASVILRIVNPTPSMAKMVAGGRVFDPQSFAASVGAGTTSHSADTEDVSNGVIIPAAAATKLVIGTAALPDAQVNAAYQATLSAYGGTPPYYWSLNSGELPAGLALDPGTGVISGTPTAAGTFTFTIQVADAAGQTDTQRYSIYAYSGTPGTLSIVTTSLPSGVQGTVYGAALEATGGVYPRVWTLDSGTLPPGLSLDSGGVISGIPSATGTYNFTVRVTDNARPNKATATRALSILINILTGMEWTISGTIYDSANFPLKDVLLRGLPGAPTTGENGTYNALVPQGWSGTVIPFKVGYTFTPEQRTYFDIIGNATNENYNSAETLVSEEWVKRDNGPALWSDDQTVGMVMDSSGNAYVLGYGDRGSTRYDYEIVKYDSTGHQVAVASYTGDQTMDFAVAITVDAANNVYVTGLSYSANMIEYIATVKYNSSLVQQAVALHKESGFSVEPVSITTDASGNVYVAGIKYQGTATPTNDIITIKYDGSLSEIWATTYSESGNSQEAAYGIAVGPDGGVYVTGTTYESGGNQDILTIKYDSAGELQWDPRFIGTGNGNDTPVGIKVTTAGDIYVAGTTVSSGTGSEFLILKYHSNGSSAAGFPVTYSYSETTRETASSMTVDSADNIYITGFLTGGALGPSLTVKYDVGGVQEWVNVQNDLNYPSSDSTVSIAVDASGNVYLGGSQWYNGTAYDYIAVKLDKDSGNRLWYATKEGEWNGFDYGGQIGVDSAGNVFLTGTSEAGSTGNDIFTVKFFGNNGGLVWRQRYDGPPNDDNFAAMALDPAGNVAILGQSCGLGTFLDFVTMKYDSAGNALWPQAQRYNGASNYSDNPRALAVDAAGNVYVAGQSDGQITLIKYAANDGHQLWLSQHAGQSFASWQPELAVDSSGYVYLAGSMPNPPYNLDYLLVKYDKDDGHEIWARTYNRQMNAVNCRDQAKAIAIDASGNIYVTGQSGVPAQTIDYDIVTVMYDSSGAFQWAAHYDGGHGSDLPIRIKADASGNVFVLGDSPGDGTQTDMVTIKYSPGGAQSWVDRYEGPGSEASHGLTVDASGNAYVTGGSAPDAASAVQDYITIKYAPGGSRAWERRYDFGTGINDTAWDVAVDDLGNVYVTGMSQGLEFSSDFATVKYDGAGNMIWVIRYNGPGHSSDYGRAILVGPASANYPVYIAGQSESAGTQGMAVALIKYKQK